MLMTNRDYKTWLTFYVVVESGRIVKHTCAGPNDLKSMTLDEVSQWVRSNGGDIYPISPAGCHTCVDEPNVSCGACESVNHPSDRMAYGIVVKRAAPLKELVGFREMYDRMKS
jgi:hypothetical protein